MRLDVRGQTRNCKGDASLCLSNARLIAKQGLQETSPLGFGLPGNFIKVIRQQHGLIAIQQYGALAQLLVGIFRAMHGLQLQDHARPQIVYLPADQCT